MATTKRGKKARAGARGSKAARGKSAAGRKHASAKTGKKTTGRAAGGKRAAAAKTAKKSAGGKGAASGTAALAQQKARFDRERGELEKRLTETVREIGQLRHHEMRVTQLERQVVERDQTIAGLRRELSELRNRPPVARAAADQTTLDFGAEEIRVEDLDESVPLDDEDDDLM